MINILFHLLMTQTNKTKESNSPTDVNASGQVIKTTALI
jgi:hypothetical protein